MQASKSFFSVATHGLIPPIILRIVRYSLIRFRAIMYRQELKANRELRNLYTGRRCFILGSGPSIKRQNLAALKNEATISLNNFFVHEKFREIVDGRTNSTLAPPIHPPQDYSVWRSWFTEMERGIPESVHLLFGLGDRSMNTRDLLSKEGLMTNRTINWFVPGMGVSEKTTSEGTDPTQIIWSAETASIYAIIYALYMNFAEIVLLGMDHDYFMYRDEKDMRMYASAAHQKDEIKLTMGEHFYSSELRNQGSIFFKYELLARQFPGRITNASAGGILEVFPRKPLSDYLGMQVTALGWTIVSVMKPANPRVPVRAIAFVPARGGSKSIPRKNIKDFCGRPLIWWTLKALQDSSRIDKIVVATDDAEIRDVVNEFLFEKCETYDRDPINAKDGSSTESVMLEYLERVRWPEDVFFVLAQATSPGTRVEDIEQAFALLENARADSLLTCTLEKKFIWSSRGEPLNYDYRARPRRQDFEGVLVENGAFYISRVGQIMRDRNRLSGRKAVYVMTGALSGIEIDEEPDWTIAERLFKMQTS